MLFNNSVPTEEVFSTEWYDRMMAIGESKKYLEVVMT
jgi:hypothetical protein